MSKRFGPFFIDANQTLILIEALHARRIPYVEKPIYVVPQMHDPRQKMETFNASYVRTGQGGGREQVSATPNGRIMLEVPDEHAEEVARMVAVLR